MLWQSAALLCGVLLRCAVALPLPAFTTLIGLVAGALLWRWRPMRAAGLLLLGLAWAQASVQSHVSGLQRIEERVLAHAQLTGIPQLGGRVTRVDALLSFPREPQRRPQRARLTWSGATGRTLHAGETWQVLLRLRPPVAALNFVGVDTERNLLRDRIQVLATVISSPLNQRLAATPPGSLAGLRERLARRISAAIDDPSAGALLAALAVGETGEITPEQWRVFNATGITHLVAISGMHVTGFAVLAMAVVRRLWSLLARRTAWPLPAREACAGAGGWVLALGYALLAGYSVPTQRTLLMLGTWLLLRQSGRSAAATASLGAALALTLLWDPLAVLAAGFWLSFLAVAAIIAIAGGRPLRQGALRSAVTVQWTVFVALLPVTMAWFGSVSLAGLLVNVLAIPLFTWVLVPAALAATVLLLVLPAAVGTVLLVPLLQAAGAVAALVSPWLAQVAASPLALWQVQAPAWWFALAVLAMVWVLPPWARSQRLAGGAVLLPLLLADPRPEAGRLVISVFDVGQSTAVLLQTREHAALWGTGDSFGSDGAAVDRVVLPALRAARISALDLLVVPRLDRDSGAGTTALLAALPVHRLLASAPDGVPAEFDDCRVAQTVSWPPWRLDIAEAVPGRCGVQLRGPDLSLGLVDRVPAGLQWQDNTAQGLRWIPQRGQSPALRADAVAAAAPVLWLGSAGQGAFRSPVWQSVMETARVTQQRVLATAQQGGIQVSVERGALQVEVARAGPWGVWRSLQSWEGIRHNP